MVDIAPQKTFTFTVKKQPRREAERKTIQRLMRLQPRIKKGLKALQQRRRVQDNVTYIRAGVEWTNRARATRLTRVEPGASFTIFVSPQLLPDIRSVGEYLDAKPAS